MTRRTFLQQEFNLFPAIIIAKFLESYHDIMIFHLAPSDVNTTFGGAPFPVGKCGRILDKINLFAFDKHSRLSSGTINAIYN